MKATWLNGTSLISSVFMPRLRSAKSSPCSFITPTAQTASSNFTPFSLKSSDPNRIVSGSRSGQTARTASSASRWNRNRFSRLPPYSSVRWLAIGEKKLAPR